jgi:CheY-like chemotaxis protein
MVYGIVQQSGGQISLESAPGRGSSFRIVFPRADGTGSPAEASPCAPLPGGAGETILVVEDEPEIRTLACEILETCGYLALGAGSAEEALGLAVRHPGPIDLLLTDVVMPGLSGTALADQLTVVRPHVRVLYMSGYAGDDLTRRGIEEEGRPFLLKPFSADVLCARVRESLDA